jgi:hypothetical protein
MESCLEEMVCRLLKRRQHESTVLELGNTKAGDTKDFSLEAHYVSQQHSMTSINGKTVRLHSMVDLITDGSAGGFDT